MNLDEMYTKVITRSSRAKHNRKTVENATGAQEGFNPSCGDDLVLSARVEDGILVDVGFEGNGCAISSASASLMADLLKGKSVEEAQVLMDRFNLMATGGELTPAELESLGPVQALAGVAHMPSRTKCATLAWHTLDSILKDSQK